MVVTRNGAFEAEVEVKGGSGFRHVVNLEHKTCTCREFQVSGKPCLHATAFITSVRGRLEDYVDNCFSVHQFRIAYEKLVPSLPDKSQWPKANHGFFLAPPILKRSAGRPKTMRYKGCTEKGSKSSRRHKCPICKTYGHHWHNCKEGDLEQLAAMLAERGPPKKRSKKTNKPPRRLAS